MLQIDSEIKEILGSIKSLFANIPGGPTEPGFWEKLEFWKNPDNRKLYGPKDDDAPTDEEMDEAEFWNATDQEKKILAAIAELGCELHSQYLHITV